MADRDITNSEAVEMMQRCKQEIIRYRTLVDYLKPKAEAYDNLITVLKLLPQPSQGYSAHEDIIHNLQKRIEELIPKPPLEPTDFP